MFPALPVLVDVWARNCRIFFDASAVHTRGKRERGKTRTHTHARAHAHTHTHTHTHTHVYTHSRKSCLVRGCLASCLRGQEGVQHTCLARARLAGDQDALIQEFVAHASVCLIGQRKAFQKSKHEQQLKQG